MTLAAMSRLPLFSTAAFTLAALGCRAEAQDASAAMFRAGPAHPGVYASIGPNLVGLQWTLPTGGDVIGSPTVVGGLAYIPSGDGSLRAVDLNSGTVRWRAELDSPLHSTPAVAGNRIVVTTRDGRIVALDRDGGKERWQVTTGPLLPFPWGHESGDVYVSSPVVSGGTVVAGAGDGMVYAVDLASGRVRWRGATEGRVRSSPAVDGGTVYVGSADGRVYAFDLATGAERWRFETEGVGHFSGDFGYDRRTIQSSPAVADGMVYVGARDGKFYALDAATGALRWRVSHETSWINTSPAVVDGVVYLGSSDASIVQAVDALTGKERWRKKLGRAFWASPAVAGPYLVIGDLAGQVFALNRDNGNVVWTFRTEAQVFGGPVVADGMVLAGSADGNVYALRTGDTPVHRAVFYDSTLSQASWNREAPEYAEYFGQRGYDRLDLTGLAGFLDVRTSDRAPSVVVFATTHLTPEIQRRFRGYLDAGGKVVWPGMPPVLWPADPKTGDNGTLADIAWDAPNRLLGVPHDLAIFDRRGVRATAVGRRWGISDRFRIGWGVAPEGVSEVLALDEWGLAAAWVKTYGGPAGTGFVRLNDHDEHAAFLAAEYRPTP